MNKKGVALILIFLVITVLIILGGAITMRSISESNLVKRYIDSTQAFWLAEAGINHELKLLKANSWKPVVINATTLGPGEYSVERISASVIRAHGYLPSQASPRVDRAIDLIAPFYKDTLYVAGDISVDGTSNSVSGDVTYGGTLSGTLNVTNGTATNDPSINPLALLNFNDLKTISQAQGNYHDASHLDGPFPASFWYDEANKIPNVVFLDGILRLKGNDHVHGFFVVGGEVVYDTTITGNVSVEGGVYTQGNFTITGGGSSMNIDGGVWVGGDATLNGGVALQYNSDYMSGIQNLGMSGSSTPKITWKETQNPYKL